MLFTVDVELNELVVHILLWLHGLLLIMMNLHPLDLLRTFTRTFICILSCIIYQYGCIACSCVLYCVYCCMCSGREKRLLPTTMRLNK